MNKKMVRRLLQLGSISLYQYNFFSRCIAGCVPFWYCQIKFISFIVNRFGGLIKGFDLKRDGFGYQSYLLFDFMFFS